MSLLDIYRNCNFNFQPEGRNIKINIKIKNGKMYIKGKSFLHQFIFKNRRRIFIIDKDDSEDFMCQSTISNFLNILLKDQIIAIKNSRLVLSE